MSRLLSRASGLGLGLFFGLASLAAEAVPTVTLTSPGDAWIYNAPAASIPLRATAVAESGASITRVEFRANGNLIGSDASAAYAWNWTNVPAGNYLVTAKAIDSLGQEAESAGLTIQVSTDNQPPKVSLSAPADKSTYVLPASLPLSASVSDIERNGKVTQLEFFANGALIATLTQSPWSTTWSNPAAGTYTLTARATDNLGAQSESLVRSVTVNASNTAPKISLTSPADKSTWVLPADLTLSASASDLEKNDGLASVEFLANGVVIANLTAAPYRFTWSNPVAGSYILTARATDKLGSQTLSLPRTVTIVDTNDVPKVSLASPANNAKYLAPANVTLTASASDIDANTPVTQVEFLANGLVLATLTQKPYTYTWDNAPTGTHSLMARATDSRGVAASSLARTISISDNNTPPTVSLTAPANNASVQAPADIIISSSVSAPEVNDSISKVEFYQGTTLIGTVTQSPWQITWVKPAAGVYMLTAKATDGQGTTTTSASRKLTVLTNQLPSVSLSAPANNQTYTAPATIALTATATDPDGTINRVQFYQGLTLIGTATAAPYVASWANVPEGSYSLTAKAIDNGGAETYSAPIAITVKSNGPKLYYLHTDHLDTPRVVTDETNKVVWRNMPLSEPFGTSPPEEDPDGDGQNFTMNLRFPGQYFDRETNTHYNYFRDNYFTELGRYGQSDPIGLLGGINTYGYVGGNPISRKDPKGLEYYTQDFPMDQPPVLSSCECPTRAPDYLQFQLDVYVGTFSGTFSRSGNSFVGGGIVRNYPNPTGVGASVSVGWLNRCRVTPQDVDGFIGGFGEGVAAGYLGIGGGAAWSPGSGTATQVGVGVGISVNPGGVSTNQGATGLGGW